MKHRSKPPFIVALFLFLFLPLGGALIPAPLVAEESQDKEIAAANFAARRTALMRMMPWEMRSDLNYLAVMADAGLGGEGRAGTLDELGTGFARLTRQYLEIYQEIAGAEKTGVSQEELDKLTQARLTAFGQEAGGLKASMNVVKARLAAATNSKRWAFANNELLPPGTMMILNLLAELADAGALNQITLAKLDVDLTRLYELHMSMNEHASDAENAARAGAYAELSARLDKDIVRVYQNLPTSPRWKEWEEAAKK